MVHSDRPKHAYLNPMSDPRIRPRRGFAAGGDGVMIHGTPSTEDGWGISLNPSVYPTSKKRVKEENSVCGRFSVTIFTPFFNSVELK